VGFARGMLDVYRKARPLASWAHPHAREVIHDGSHRLFGGGCGAEIAVLVPNEANRAAQLVKQNPSLDRVYFAS